MTEPERRMDIDARDRLSEVQASYERFSTLVWRALVVLAAVLVASFAVQGWLIHENRLRANTSQRNSVRIDESLRRALFLVCTETNLRHNATVATLDAQLKEITDPKIKVQLKHIRDSNVAFIDALAPHRDDCNAYVARLLRG